MSERLTTQWTNTAEEAFGESGAKGRIGELLILNTLQEQSIPAVDLEEDKRKQVRGLDIQTEKYSLDVKTNLHEGTFFIEVDPLGWLFHHSKISDIIIHVDPITKEVVWYHREVAKQKLRINCIRPLIRIHEGNFKSEWMSQSWDDLFILLKS